VTTSVDDEVLNPDAGTTSLNPKEARIWSIRDDALAARTRLAERTGALMSPLGSFLGFYEHPRLFDPDDGSFVLRLDDLV
jgi:hypothetical protein